MSGRKGLSTRRGGLPAKRTLSTQELYAQRAMLNALPPSEERSAALLRIRNQLQSISRRSIQYG